MALRPAIFLDKDGTVLQDVPYNVDPANMIFAPGAAAGLARLALLGVPLYVITNQPGIALGRFCLDDLADMQQHLSQMFTQVGATLDGLYFCPHHPEGTVPQYACECECRKPAPGLLLHAAKQHGIDLARSWLIGDILNDIEAGNRAGCQTILIDNGNETEWDLDQGRTPDYRVADLEEASRFVLGQRVHLTELYS
ncbi:hydrolase, HAD-superfamily, subfamily IIIA [Advenella kashmirensis WT001]|uniref:D,D-heptose 1,7-bisphosphate phosphatase n=1 Tax=Advenella kashmirensis (strain DSM 17095 / LMG 22695 / WT001) TaxID=1036672 RepID=I3UAC6_ADVKW|nr:HAD-IIIA family hydrolase [Advenella kashmirensis]AFK61964.1 hydrolase, HAD-superfamily, subfamily IIIA [Advenella kashmirensis WT001]